VTTGALKTQTRLQWSVVTEERSLSLDLQTRHGIRRQASHSLVTRPRDCRTAKADARPEGGAAFLAGYGCSGATFSNPYGQLRERLVQWRSPLRRGGLRLAIYGFIAEAVTKQDRDKGVIKVIYVLFFGMAASGIAARVTLLIHRGGFFLEDQARKSSGMGAFDLLATVCGLAAFVICFLLFDWWWPLIALAVGYWLVAPFAVAGERFAFFYQTQIVTSLVRMVCSLLICVYYFELI